jgi:hypothetical protein
MDEVSVGEDPQPATNVSTLSSITASCALFLAVLGPRFMMIRLSAVKSRNGTRATLGPHADQEREQNVKHLPNVKPG